MNKMHSVAKIVIGYWLLVIFTSFCVFALQLISQIFMSSFFPGFGLYSILIYSVLYLLITAVLIYIFIRKRDFLAEKMVGKTELPPPDKNIDWLPTAYRLMSVTGGLLCLYRSTSVIFSTLSRYFYVKNYNTADNSSLIYPYNIQLSQLLSYLILFIAGIYLVCGAPHFVRWQVKKTLEFCKDITETKDND